MHYSNHRQLVTNVAESLRKKQIALEEHAELLARVRRALEEYIDELDTRDW